MLCGSLWFLVTFLWVLEVLGNNGGSCWFLMVLGGSWLFLGVIGGSWWFLALFFGSLWSLVVLGGC